MTPRKQRRSVNIAILYTAVHTRGQCVRHKAMAGRESQSRHPCLERRLAGASLASPSSGPPGDSPDQISHILRVPSGVMRRHLFPLLDARALCALQATCRELQTETSADALWDERLSDDFPGCADGGCLSAGWTAQRAYGLLADGPTKWARRATHERFTATSSSRASSSPASGSGASSAPALCLHSHEGILAAGYADGYIRMFEGRGGRDDGGAERWCLREPCPTRAAHVGGMVTSVDSCRGRLVSAGSDATIAVFDADTGVELERRGGTDGGTRGINRVQVERVTGGAGVAAADAGDDGAVNLYDTTTWQTASTLAAHSGAAYALCWLGAGPGEGGHARCLLTGGFDGAIKLWDARTACEEANLRLGVGGGGGGIGGYRVYDVCADPHSPLVFSAHGDFSIRAWDARTWKQVAALRGHTRWAERLAVAPGGSALVSAAADTTVRVWDVRNVGKETWDGAGAAAGTLKHHSGTVWDACFHGADTLMTCSSDGTIGALTLCPTNRVVSDAARSAAGGAGGAARAKAKQTPLPGFSWDQGMSGAKHRAELLAHGGHHFRFANE